MLLTEMALSNSIVMGSVIVVCELCEEHVLRMTIMYVA